MPSFPFADAFYPSANVITLSEERYAKNDPSFWAVGAHEIGHAMAYRGSVLFTVVERAARIARETLVGVGGYDIYVATRTP